MVALGHFRKARSMSGGQRAAELPRRHAIALALGGIAASLTSPCASAANSAEAPTLPPVEVIGTMPLAGIGVSREQVPANVQSVGSQQIEQTQSFNLPDFMARQMPSVTVNETQDNPYQPDVNYRGFTISPLLGVAQGLSVYMDGVRVNEPFGDTVNWDLLPNSAFAGMNLIPGSNPVFGLNTLGGALAIRTKNGFDNPGGKVEVSGGSFGRKTAGFEGAMHNDLLAGYVAADWFKEDGWRDFSDSEVKQFFGKLSLHRDWGTADLSLTRAVTRLTGNGTLPLSMYATHRDQIYTKPDQTRNDLTQLTLNSNFRLSDDSSLSVNLYHRRNKTRTLNGDANDDYEDDYADDPTTAQSGANNRTQTRQEGSGAAAQWNLSTDRQQLAFGASVDYARIRFAQTQELGMIDANRGVSDLQPATDVNALHGTTRTSSLYVTDTVALSKTVSLTGSARYNQSRVILRDQLNPNPPNLDGDHSYHKLNPALGLTWQVLPTLNAYAGFNQGSRVPTPIELGCADAANPCSLPNSMASDPDLKQVVARTLEAGLRGKLPGDIAWNAGVYRTINTNDILFVGTSHSAGYFTNFGKTQRQGVELGLSGRLHSVEWQINYSYLRATFRSAACLLSASNSTAGASPECASDEIRVRSGDRLPGLPEHSLKLGLNWHANDWLNLGGDMQAFSGQYARGNENNQDPAGRIPGYALFNLNAQADLGKGWQAFAKVSNVFDRHYATAAALAVNSFDANGKFLTNPDDWSDETFISPGAPRAGWIGIRYRWL